MSSAEEYREFAEECLGWARTARSDRERRIFLQMDPSREQAAAPRVVTHSLSWLCVGDRAGA